MKLLKLFKKSNKTEKLVVLEAILKQYSKPLGLDFDGYRNHCYRVYQFCQALAKQPLTDEQNEKLQIALAFHDLGLFTNDTVDYLLPSMELAKDYLNNNKKTAWQDEILLMIDQHHKLTRYQGQSAELVELLRKADAVDFSLGLVHHGLNKEFIKQVKKSYPNSGFHKMIVDRQILWLKDHPKNPFPIFKL